MKTTGQDLFLEAAVQSLDEEPLTLGTVAVGVMRLMGNPKVGLPSLTRAISADIGLSSKIIRKANCAFYAGSEPVTSLPLAILKIGFTATRSMVIASAYRSLFREGDSEGFEERLWRHSLGVGIGARTVAHHADGTFGEEAFVCGLVHDVAKLVLFQRFPEVYRPILKRTIDNPGAEKEIEMTVMGFTHAELSAMILERWGFERAAIRSVRYHHDPEAISADGADTPINRDAAQLAYAINLANEIVRQFEDPHPGVPVPSLDDNPGLQHFGFNARQQGRICDEMRFRIGDELQLFGEAGTHMF
ncbi:MAG: HDOD domain-containing protein [Candidatus Zixiibacteriota bacterium]